MDIRLYFVSEAAEICRCAVSTIKDWIKSGELEARVWVRDKTHCIYMIDSWDLENFMLRHFPRRSTLSSDAENHKARRAYRILRFKKPPQQTYT